MATRFSMGSWLAAVVKGGEEAAWICSEGPLSYY